MNLQTVTAFAAAAVFALAGAVRADSCDTTSLTTLLTSTDVTQCASDSGYSFSSLTTPTEAEMALMCTSTSCQSALESVEALNLGDCTVGTFAIESELIEPVVEYCAGSSSMSAEAETGSTSTDDDVAATVAPAEDSSSSTDSEIVATVEPVVANSTSSASTDTDTKVGDSDSGSDYEIETPEPTSADSSASEETEEASASSSGSDTTASSGSNAGATIAPASAVLGSAITASVIALFL